jgi:hypothetical protein
MELTEKFVEKKLDKCVTCGKFVEIQSGGLRTGCDICNPLNSKNFVGNHNGKVVLASRKEEEVPKIDTSHMKETEYWKMLEKSIFSDYHTLVWIGRTIICPICEEYLRRDNVDLHFEKHNKHSYIVRHVFKDYSNFIEYIKNTISTLMDLDVAMDYYDPRSYSPNNPHYDIIRDTLDELNLAFRWIKPKISSQNYKLTVTVLNNDKEHNSAISPPDWFLKEEKPRNWILENSNAKTTEKFDWFSNKDESEFLEEQMIKLALEESEKELKRKEYESSKKDNADKWKEEIINNYKILESVNVKEGTSVVEELYDSIDEDYFKYTSDEEDLESDE